MYPLDRRAQILQVVNDRRLISINEISALFDVSKSTIRRDLLQLEKDSLIETSYGCVRAVAKASTDPTFSARASVHHAEKVAIAHLAVDLVQDGDCILLDGGTTVAEFAQALATSRKQITVVTTAINIACILEHISEITVVIVGGILRDSKRSLIGSLAEQSLNQLHISKAFIGAGGITTEAGLTNYHMLEAEIKRKIIAISDQVIVLADFSKFGVKTTIAFSTLHGINTIVTDDAVEGRFVNQLTDLGIRILIAQTK